MYRITCGLWFLEFVTKPVGDATTAVEEVTEVQDGSDTQVTKHSDLKEVDDRSDTQEIKIGDPKENEEGINEADASLVSSKKSKCHFWYESRLFLSIYQMCVSLGYQENIVQMERI